MEEVTRALDPSLYKRMRSESQYLDKLGRLGATIYDCDSYCACIHSEETDVCPGFCSQIKLNADTRYDEFAFIYLQYGVYIVTESNMIW